jgi:hypothetical protein
MPDHPFPKTLAALRALEKSHSDRLWDLGDALIEECGPAGAHGVNNGSLDRLKEAARFLRKEGFNYTHRYLEVVRSTASAFSDRTRVRSLSFSVHRAAGEPSILEAVQRQATRNGRPVTVSAAKAARSKSDRKDRDRQDDTLPASGRAKKLAWDSAQDAKRASHHFRKVLEPHQGKLAPEDIHQLASLAKDVASAWQEQADELRGLLSMQEAAE